ncbi:hypothetical protein BpHYR1_043980 [Brachionus plicatilis]|uniref:Uncharacterized protein n=1 Tax=Brachionus plicatilis TaxID=10195 RepID=A0A3M7RRF3_BRAPC|nr:hypothetical protein BpHYR1_043980 [Brachionus plicatilis]
MLIETKLNRVADFAGIIKGSLFDTEEILKKKNFISTHSVLAKTDLLATNMKLISLKKHSYKNYKNYYYVYFFLENNMLLLLEQQLSEYTSVALLKAFGLLLKK